ncbi:hypothetical protein GCM10027446_33350 [Angustibacter peucedani]
MGRRYDDPVEVRTTGEPEGDEPEAPAAFVWRDRLYVVRGVLSHWYERRVWWREAAASALLGLRSEVDVAAQGAVPSGGRVPAGLALDDVPARRSPLEPAEREVWRVEAAAGRSSPVGVYDLVHDPGSGAPAADRWRLVHVED